MTPPRSFSHRPLRRRLLAFLAATVSGLVLLAPGVASADSGSGSGSATTTTAPLVSPASGSWSAPTGPDSGSWSAPYSSDYSASWS